MARSHALDEGDIGEKRWICLREPYVNKPDNMTYGYALSLYRSRIRSPQSETPRHYVDNNLWRWETLTLMTFVRKECRCQWTTCDVDLVAHTAIQLPRIIPSSIISFITWYTYLQMLSLSHSLLSSHPILHRNKRYLWKSRVELGLANSPKMIAS